MPLLQTWCICLYCRLSCSVIHDLQTPELLLLLPCSTCTTTEPRVVLVCTWVETIASQPPNPVGHRGRSHRQCLHDSYPPFMYPWADSRVWSGFRTPSPEVFAQHQHSICQDTAPTFYWSLLRVLFFLFLSNPLIIWGYTLKKLKAIPYPKVWGPKSSPEAGAEGMVLRRAWQTTSPLRCRRDRGKKTRVWAQELCLYLERHPQWKCFSSVISPTTVENSIIC